MAKKKPNSKPKPKQNAIDIDNEEPILAFNIRNDGKFIGVLEAPIVDLHRLALKCQQEAIEKDGNAENYFTLYSAALKKEYKIDISETASYRIANAVFGAFNDLKKSTSG